MNDKAIQTAKKWIYAALMYAIHDCSDSSENEEKYRNKFDGYVDDSISIEDFVKQNLYDEYIKNCVDVVKEYTNFEGKLITESSEIEQNLENAPSQLPIKWEEIKDDVRAYLNKK